MRALAEESRLKLVRRLLTGPCCVNELCESLGLTPYNASQNLRVLREAGLVAMEKPSQPPVYALAADLLRRMQPGTQTLDLGCCQFHLDKIQD